MILAVYGVALIHTSGGNDRMPVTRAGYTTFAPFQMICPFLITFSSTTAPQSIKPTFWVIFCVAPAPRIAPRHQLVRIKGCNRRTDPLGLLGSTSRRVSVLVCLSAASLLPILCCCPVVATPPSEKSNFRPLQLSEVSVPKWKQHVQHCGQHEGLPVADGPPVIRLDTSRWQSSLSSISGALHIRLAGRLNAFRRWFHRATRRCVALI